MGDELVSRFTGDGYEQPTLNRAQIEENCLHAPNAIARLVAKGETLRINRCDCGKVLSGLRRIKRAMRFGSRA